MREIRSWVFLTLGLLLAALTGVAVYGVAQEGATRQVGVVAETVHVVVAGTDIAARTVLRPELIARRSYPRALVPSGALLNAEDAVGQTTLAAIPSGVAIVRSQLIAAGGVRGLSLTLEEGKVLVAFPTADPLTAAGLVQVGDRVDVLATVVTGGDHNTRRTQTIVQNLEVIDIVGRDQTQRGGSLTFVVDHQVALVLKYLRDSQATIDVVVRSRAESGTATTTAVDQHYLVRVYGIQR